MAFNPMRELRRAFALLSIAAALPAAPAHAQVDPNEPDPAVWVKSVYDLYKRAETDESLQRQANYRVVVRRASKSLAALFRKDAACMKRNGGGPCAIDADFIVQGQDNRLSAIVVAPAQIDGDRASVAVSFRNFDSASRNVFQFVREGGVWKVNDIRMTGAEGGAPSLLSTMLRQGGG